MATQVELLRELKQWLYTRANSVEAESSEGDDTAVRRVLALVYNRLDVALDAPEDASDVTTFRFQAGDMCVVVFWPEGGGRGQSVTFDRNGGPELDTLTTLDTVIVRALLEHALGMLP